METRLALVDAGASEPSLAEDQVMHTSVSVPGERARPPACVVAYLNGYPQSQDNRCRADAFRLALGADKKVVKEHAQWRNPELMSRVDAAASSAAAGVDAAIPTRVADTFSRLLGQE